MCRALNPRPSAAGDVCRAPNPRPSPAGDVCVGPSTLLQVASVSGRQKLWQQLHGPLLPVMGRCLEDLGRAGGGGPDPRALAALLPICQVRV